MTIEEMIAKLIRVGLENDMKSFELIALTIANKLKVKNKIVSNEIINTISYKNIGSSTYRAVGLKEVPIDIKTKVNLAKIEEPLEVKAPILSKKVKYLYDRFLKERENAQELLKFGVKPNNSILLYGEPGVGKTYSVKWLSYKLNKPIVNLDLSSVISSYLGETGSNLKMVLDYAKEVDGILFLDEFDAIAKKRDDSRDIGELKRIVNVLLKELENWPDNSIIVAATNHPELLDKAIWRRFDVKINIELPTNSLRKEIINRELEGLNINDYLYEFIVEVTDGINSAEIVRICQNIKKSYILDSKDIQECVLKNIKIDISNLTSSDKIRLCKKLKKINSKIKPCEIEEITGIPKSTIYKYLAK